MTLAASSLQQMSLLHIVRVNICSAIMPKKDLRTVVIEKLVPGGLGLGRLKEGIVVMVRYVLPGEKVLVNE